jgi:UDP-perosamine 4-acetyltransferase
MKGIVVIGAGGHAKVVIETLRASGKQVACCVADESADEIGVPVLRGDDHLLALRADGHSQAIIAVGDNALRARLAERAAAAGYELISAISPHAVISPSAKLGRGVVIMPGAIINAGAVIEDLAIINTAAVVEHDSKVGYAAHLGPLCGIAGGVSVGRLAFLGLGAKVIPGVKIGAGTIVGAGAVVIADLPDIVTAVGVPARVVKAVV